MLIFLSSSYDLQFSYSDQRNDKTRVNEAFIQATLHVLHLRRTVVVFRYAGHGKAFILLSCSSILADDRKQYFVLLLGVAFSHSLKSAYRDWDERV